MNDPTIQAAYNGLTLAALAGVAVGMASHFGAPVHVGWVMGLAAAVGVGAGFTLLMLLMAEFGPEDDDD